MAEGEVGDFNLLLVLESKFDKCAGSVCAKYFLKGFRFNFVCVRKDEMFVGHALTKNKMGPQKGLPSLGCKK